MGDKRANSGKPILKFPDSFGSRERKREKDTGCPLRRTVSGAYELIKFNMTCPRPFATDRIDAGNLDNAGIAPAAASRDARERAISCRKCRVAASAVKRDLYMYNAIISP